jgi:hypothetical protein
VSEPTHIISENTTSLVDLIYLSVPSSVLSCVTIPPLANSDHLGLYFSISAGQKKSATKPGDARSGDTPMETMTVHVSF